MSWSVATQTQLVNIEEHLRGLCADLGLPYQHVGQLTVMPSRVEAVIFLERDGKHYLDDDGEVAHEVQIIEVTT